MRCREQLRASRLLLPAEHTAQEPRRPPLSLSLGSLGVSHVPFAKRCRALFDLIQSPFAGSSNRGPLQRWILHCARWLMDRCLIVRTAPHFPFDYRLTWWICFSGQVASPLTRLATLSRFVALPLFVPPPLTPNPAVERMASSVHADCSQTRRPTGSRRAPRRPSLTLFSLGVSLVSLANHHRAYFGMMQSCFARRRAAICFSVNSALCVLTDAEDA